MAVDEAVYSGVEVERAAVQAAHKLMLNRSRWIQSAMLSATHPDDRVGLFHKHEAFVECAGILDLVLQGIPLS